MVPEGGVLMSLDSVADPVDPVASSASLGGPVKDPLHARDIRRTELIEAAIRVIVREGPSASMAQMAAEAGVSKPILYRHFCDRADLVAAVAEHTLSDVNDALARASETGGSVRNLVGSIVDAYFDFIERNAAVYRFLMHRTTLEALDDQLILNGYVRMTGQRVASLLEEKLRAAGRDVGASEVWGFGISGMVHAVGAWWLEGGDLSRDRVRAHLTDLIVDGLPLHGTGSFIERRHTVTSHGPLGRAVVAGSDGGMQDIAWSSLPMASER